MSKMNSNIVVIWFMIHLLFKLYLNMRKVNLELKMLGSEIGSGKHCFKSSEVDLAQTVQWISAFSKLYC